MPDAPVISGGGGVHPANASVPTSGSILLVRASRNNATGAPFITLSENAAVRGLTFFWPDSSPLEAPVPYPWAIDLVGGNAAVLDVLLLNPWDGIRSIGFPRHYIARVQGQPAHIGLFIDSCYDIGRVEDVHWMHFYSDHPDYLAFLGTEGTGFIVGRSDWEYFYGTFVFEMAVGYHFIKTATGVANGEFTGIGADACQNASVLVDDVASEGVLLTGGEFTSFAQKPNVPDVGAMTQIIVNATNSGALRFVNCAFWGPSASIARVEGTGSVGFDSCIFVTWDGRPANESTHSAAAIDVGGGDLLVRGCDFQSNHSGGQALLREGTGRVIFTENLVAGTLNVTNLGASVAIVNNNAPQVPSSL